MPYKAIVVVMAGALCVGGTHALAQDDSFVKTMAKKFRMSTTYLRVTKELSTGEVIFVEGAGLVVTNGGHVLTSCHVVDKRVRDKKGSVVDAAVVRVTIEGSVGTRNGSLEKFGYMFCAQEGIDLALIKFADTTKQRFPIPIKDVFPVSDGDEIAAIGYPLLKNIEYFPRRGILGSVTPEDVFSVDMTMNPGDSGGPVFDKSLRLVGVAEGGFPESHIGVVRPILHAGGLLSAVGVQLSAVTPPLPSAPDPKLPIDSNIQMGSLNGNLTDYFKNRAIIPQPSPETVTVSYPYSRVFGVQSEKNTGNDPSLLVGEVKAKPGYRIVDTKFITLDKQNVKILSVSPQSGGAVVRTSIAKSESPDVGTAFVRGIVQTTQVRN